MMILMPIVYVSDVKISTGFYQTLGFEVIRDSRTGQWAELRLGDAMLSLHGASSLAGENSPRIELCFVATEPLETVYQRIKRAGVKPIGNIVDEAFGRSFVVRDPDGLSIQINEHDAELYT
jgi:predicted lactoylglutathione lyase